MKPIKFDLPLNGTRVGTLEQLQNNLCAELLEPFRSGKLTKWLRVRHLTEQADAVESLLAADNDHEVSVLKSLCGLFGGETEETLLRAAIVEHKQALPLSQSAIDDEVDRLKAGFAEKEREYQQKIETIKAAFKEKQIAQDRDFVKRTCVQVLLVTRLSSIAMNINFAILKGNKVSVGELESWSQELNMAEISEKLEELEAE